MNLIISKSWKNSFAFTKLLHTTLFCFNDTTAVNPSPHDGGSHVSANLDPTAYDIFMLYVNDILFSPLAFLVLPSPVPEPVCEMSTPALFTMAQASPQPQSVDSASRLNQLPSPATSSSSIISSSMFT